MLCFDFSRVKKFDQTRKNLKEKSSKAKHADFKRKLDAPFSVITTDQNLVVPTPIIGSVDSNSSSSSSSTAYDREYQPMVMHILSYKNNPSGFLIV